MIGLLSSHEFKMDFEQLEITILINASKMDLIPISLVGLYDVPTEVMLNALTSLIRKGFLELADNNKLLITDNGINFLKEYKKVPKETNRHHSHLKFKSKKRKLKINEPYLPIVKNKEGVNKTSNEK